MIAPHAEGVRKTRRPKPHERPDDAGKLELALRFGRVDQSGAGFWWIDCYRPYVAEPPTWSRRENKIRARHPSCGTDVMYD